MKIVQINAICGAGSTGKICVDISKLLTKKNIENYIFYVGDKSGYNLAINYAGNYYIKLQALKTRILGNYGFNSKYATQKLINHLKKINPDIVMLHNIHGHNVHLGMLFKYLKNENKKVFWVFHDCWAFTGCCPHFYYIKCDKWRTKCQHCPEYKKMSWFFDRSKMLYNRKKQLFTSISDMTIITPSKWLGELVGESFLKKYPVKVINNGIDLDLFKPTKGNFIDRYNLDGKKIILGVAHGFGEKKGLKYFIELSNKISDEYRIVLVGVGKQCEETLPDNIIGIERTENQKELAEIYTAATAFVNCTLEDNFPTVNIEALACGTPVITFNTGGSVECIDENVGRIVEKGNVDEIVRLLENNTFSEDVSEKCRKKAEDFYDARFCFERYMKLF